MGYGRSAPDRLLRQEPLVAAHPVRKTLIRVIKLAVPSLLQERKAPRLQRGLPVTSGLPHRPRLMGGGRRAVSSRSLRTQLPPPSNLDSFMRWVALATLLLVV